MEFDLLDYLYNINRYNEVDIAPFIKLHNIDAETLKSILLTLKTHDLINYKVDIRNINFSNLSETLMIQLTLNGKADVEERAQTQQTERVNNSIIATNDNVRTSNDISARMATRSNLILGATGLFIAISAVFQICQYLKPIEVLTPGIQQIDTALKNQRKEQDSLKQTLRIVDSSLEKILQNLPKK
jgi:hypothetical protein